MFGRNKVAMLVAEFLGTGFLTLVVLSVQRSTIGIAYFVALAAGLLVATMSYVFTNVSGAHFNPAITIGSLLTRRVKVLAAAAYIVAQLLGAWAAYGVYTYFVNSSLQQIGGHFTLRVMVAEAVGAFIFTFIWAAMAAQRLNASLAGAGLTLGILVASVASIGFINPAVALGARAWEIWGSMGWGTYAAGPVVGGIIGFGLYELFFSEAGWNFLRGGAVAGAGASTVVTPASVVSRSTTRNKAAAKRKTTAKKRK
jgi:glycerol uptake facilitator-like aquaporin